MSELVSVIVPVYNIEAYLLRCLPVHRLGWLAYNFIFMCLILVLGILVFNKVQKNFMDTV